MAGLRAWAVLLLVVGAFVVLASGSIFGDKSAGEQFQEGAETAGSKAGEVVKESQRQVEDATAQAEENAKSWGDWAKEKITTLSDSATPVVEEQYGAAKDAADGAAGKSADFGRDVLSKTREVLSKGQDTIKEKFSVYFKKWTSVVQKNYDAYRKGSTPDILQVVDETKDVAQETGSEATDKAKKVGEEASSTTKQATEEAKDKTDDVVETTKQGWEAAKGKSAEAADEAKRNYEAAKEEL
eukprot:TRINITY_DN8_c0_g1_i2.p1 TRINITY_DN8_c0_g1~~TRINITY_DN8_c0_g1_i2.p1  ORF type:complete len:241 (+),score=71.59 TRINITY_DN8_c0_g1_i2:191-913(+)